MARTRDVDTTNRWMQRAGDAIDRDYAQPLDIPKLASIAVVSKGVDTTQEPTEQPYGIDCGIRDQFGNHIRISPLADQMGEITDEVEERWAPE